MMKVLIIENSKYDNFSDPLLAIPSNYYPF